MASWHSLRYVGFIWSLFLVGHLVHLGGIIYKEEDPRFWPLIAFACQLRSVMLKLKIMKIFMISIAIASLMSNFQSSLMVQNICAVWSDHNFGVTCFKSLLLLYLNMIINKWVSRFEYIGNVYLSRSPSNPGIAFPSWGNHLN